MYIPDQKFTDDKTLRDILDEFNDGDGSVVGLYEKLVVEFNKKKEKNEDIDTAIDGMSEFERMNLYNELLNDYAVPLLMKAYDSFEVESYSLYGIIDDKKELLTSISM